MTKVRKKIGTIPINDIEQQVQQSTSAAITQMQQEVSDFIDEETAQYPEIGGTFKYIEDPEGRTEIKTDSEGKILSYRDSEGVMHENVGIETSKLTLTEDGAENLKSQLDEVPVKKNWYLPKFGKVNIKSETFYLTADPRWNTKDDVVCIQMYDNTAEIAAQRKTLSYYYIKSTLTPLAGGGYDRNSVNENSVQLELCTGKDVVKSNDHFYMKITKVDGNYYLTSTLEKDSNGIYSISYVYGSIVQSVKVNYNDSNPNQTTISDVVEVSPITDVPPYKAWPVTKKLEHFCLADIDFGPLYNKYNSPISIKFQGSGSTGEPKKGLRLTFYKNNDYKKKDKVKIGEMVKLSGYNMKSYSTDPSRVKDPVISNLMIEMWETRGTECYPWNKDNNIFCGATGFIKSFPIETWFGEEFYGLQFFGLKKDEKNYMLDGDDDSSGIFCSGADNVGFTNGSHIDWEDEMMDEMSQSTADAIDELHKYTKGFVDGTIEIDGQTVEFTNDMLEDHIDIYSWIDYWIGLELFLLWDNSYHNVILYSGKDKKKFSTFFYDLDITSFDSAPSSTSFMDIMENGGYDMSFWKKFTKEYKDCIINRYAQLRKKVLTVENINSIFRNYVSKIPERVFLAEEKRWGIYRGVIKEFEDRMAMIEERLKYLDNNYFNL